MVAVLWILGALATLAMIYAVYVTNTAVALAVNDDRLQAEALVTAALELTALQLTGTPGGPPPRGNFAFRLGSASVDVEFRSEAARIDLNMASKELLAGLFASLGVRPETADGYADRVLAWRKTPDDQDTEPAGYRSAGRRYAPRGASFPHAEELSLVLGFQPELVERVMPFVTVYSGQPEINVLAAEPQVIAALPGMTPDRLYAILAQRQAQRPDLLTLTTLLEPVRSFATTDGNASTRVTVRIRFDNGRLMNSDVVILALSGDSEPYRILSWRDDPAESAIEGARLTGPR